MSGSHDKTYATKVEPYLKDISKWYGEGMTKKSIAKTLGIGYTSLMNYQRDYDDVAQAFANAERSRDMLVMDSLFKLTQSVETTETIESRNKETGEMELTKVTKRNTMPNVKAIQLYGATKRIFNSYDDELTRANIRKVKAEADIKEDIAQKLASGEITNDLLLALVKANTEPESIMTPVPEPVREDDPIGDGVEGGSDDDQAE